MNGTKILIGYDGSECANAALEDLKRAGLSGRVEAFVVSAADVFLPLTGGAMDASLPESALAQIELSEMISKEMVVKASALAEDAARRLREMFPDWQVKAEGFADSPAWGILKKAEEWKPDLIIVGAHGWNAEPRLILGSVSQKIATEAPCSVRIVHGRPHDLEAPLRLVAGIDGSSYAYEALNQLASRHWKKGTAVHLVTVLDARVMTAIFSPDKELHRRIGAPEDRGYRWIERLTEEAVKKMTSQGLTVTSLNKKGDPKKVLLEEAREWGADCIFAGARGLGGILHFLTGSVSAALAARAHCTVEIVRSARQDAVKPAAPAAGACCRDQHHCSKTK